MAGACRHTTSPALSFNARPFAPQKRTWACVSSVAPTAVSAAESLHAPQHPGISEHRLPGPDTRLEIPYYCRREPSLVRLWCD